MKKENLNACFTKKTINNNKLLINSQKKLYKQVVQSIENCKTTTRLLIAKMSEESNNDPAKSKQKLRHGRKSLNEFPTYEYIRTVLMRAKAPMHITDILPAIEEEGWTTSNPNARYAAVCRALRDPSNMPLFKRVGKGLYKYNHGGYLRVKKAA